MAGNPGSAGTVQAGNAGMEDDAEGLAGAYQQITGRNRKAQGPNAAAYDKQVDEAQGNAAAYGDQALNYTQSGPTIANQFQDQSRTDIGGNVGSQRMLAEHLGDIMSGKDVTGAKNQIQQGTDAGIAAQMSMARSAKGGGAAQAGAYRAAQQQGAIQQAGVAAQAGQLQAQLASQAAGQQANVYGNIGQQLGQQYGLEQGSAIQQAQLQSANQGQIDQTRLGYGALGNNAQAGSLNALNGYTQGNLAAQGLQPGIDAQNGGGKLIGTGAQVAGAMMMSDERVKGDIKSEGDGSDKTTKRIGALLSSLGSSSDDASSHGSDVGGPGYTSDERTKSFDRGGGSRVDAFLDGIHPLSYHYKSADLEPRSRPTGGRYLGISAQDLEAVPEVGHQMVSEGPRGKQVEIGPSLSAALAGIARLHERVKELEGEKHVTSDMAAKADVVPEGEHHQPASWPPNMSERRQPTGDTPVRQEFMTHAEYDRAPRRVPAPPGAIERGMAGLAKYGGAVGPESGDGFGATNAVQRMQEGVQILGGYEPVDVNGIVFDRMLRAPKEKPRKPQQPGPAVAHAPAPSGSFDEQVSRHFGAPPRPVERATTNNDEPLASLLRGR